MHKQSMYFDYHTCIIMLTKNQEQVVSSKNTPKCISIDMLQGRSSNLVKFDNNYSLYVVINVGLGLLRLTLIPTA